MPDAAIRATREERSAPARLLSSDQAMGRGCGLERAPALLATVEVKSQVGSFGNNFNNRVEEAVGSATDFWKAYEYGRFQPSGRPWLGYLFMLEEDSASVAPKKTRHAGTVRDRR
ncbi:MAG: PaeR7I family type II restriction endonuclease [Rhodopseudomonas palustris]|nr:PaeR7I family type II restriction endonuclease [Rhodopseudomonas palustris]